jgi:hypothetical protein
MENGLKPTLYTEQLTRIQKWGYGPVTWVLGGIGLIMNFLMLIVTSFEIHKKIVSLHLYEMVTSLVSIFSLVLIQMNGFTVPTLYDHLRTDWVGSKIANQMFEIAHNHVFCFLQHLCQTGFKFLIVGINFFRYITICKPNLIEKILSLKMTCLCIIGMFTLSSINAALSVQIEWELDNEIVTDFYDACFNDTLAYKSWKPIWYGFILLEIVFSQIPTLGIVVFILQIRKTLRKSCEFLQKSSMSAAKTTRIAKYKCIILYLVLIGGCVVFFSLIVDNLAAACFVVKHTHFTNADFQQLSLGYNSNQFFTHSLLSLVFTLMNECRFIFFALIDLGYKIHNV